MCCLLRNLCNSCGTARTNSCRDNDVDMRIVHASNGGCGCGWNHGGSVVVISNGGCGCNHCGYNGYNGYYDTANTCSCESATNTANTCGCGTCGYNY